MKKFKFSEENLKLIPEILKRYPEDRPHSAVMPLLDLAQSQQGWVSLSVIECVAELLKMPVIRVQEVATFYSMYQLEPVGDTLIQVCTTTPCWLRGSDEVVKICKKKLGLALGETKDNITLQEVQCLGACIDAPVIQVKGEYIERVDEAKMDAIISKAKSTKVKEAKS